MAGVETQGCCINVFQDYFRDISKTSAFSYDPQRVNDACNVGLPERCSSKGLFSMATIMISAFVMYLTLI